jgi:hypothetical protein
MKIMQCLTLPGIVLLLRSTQPKMLLLKGEAFIHDKDNYLTISIIYWQGIYSHAGKPEKYKKQGQI